VEDKHPVVWQDTAASIEFTYCSGRQIKVSRAIWLPQDASTKASKGKDSLSLHNLDNIPLAVMRSTTDGNYVISEWPPVKQDRLDDGEWTISITFRSIDGLECKYECLGTLWHKKQQTKWGPMRLLNMGPSFTPGQAIGDATRANTCGGS